MTTFRSDFSYLGYTDNALVNMYIVVDNHTHHFLTYAILLIIFVVSAYIIIRQFNDTGKSLLYSCHITTMVALIIYYMGRVISYTFLPDIVILGLLVIESLAIAGMYYARTD